MTATTSERWSAVSRTVFLAFCLIVATLILYEHTLHVLGLLPFAFLLACPLMHFFMHRGHGHAHGNGGPPPEVSAKGGPDDA